MGQFLEPLEAFKQNRRIYFSGLVCLSVCVLFYNIQYIPESSRIFQNLPEYSKIFRNLLESSGKREKRSNVYITLIADIEFIV